jgi:hypothetical protein
MAIEPNIVSRAAQSGFRSRMWLESRSLAITVIESWMLIGFLNKPRKYKTNSICQLSFS